MKFKNGSILNTRDILYVELRKIERTVKWKIANFFRM
jgi:hypothetical protein